MVNKNYYKTITDLEHILNDLLKLDEFHESTLMMDEINKFQKSSYRKINRRLNSVSKGILIKDDGGLHGINIDKKIKGFLNKLDDKFNEYLFDEVAIMKYEHGKVFPIYFYTINVSRIIEIESSKEKLTELKLKLIGNLQFFIDNILNKGGLQDGEGTIAGNSVGEAFDAILRIGEYIVGFNNSSESIESLKLKLGISHKEIIHEISQFFYELK